MIKIDQFFDPESTTNQLTINFSTTIPHPDVFVGNLNIEYVNVPNCFSKKILLPIRRSDDSNHLFTTDPGVPWHSPVGSSAAAALSSAWWIAQAPQTSHVMARTISSMSIMSWWRQKWCTKHKTKLFLYSYWSYWNGHWAGTPSLRSWLEEALDAMPRTEYVSVESQHLTACHRLSQWFPAGLRTL